jgi:hypothetical protein
MRGEIKKEKVNKKKTKFEQGINTIRTVVMESLRREKRIKLVL